MQVRSQAIERITRQELKERIERGEEIVIVDARSESAFMASNVRPRDSIRIVPGADDGEIARLPKNKTIVTV